MNAETKQERIESSVSKKSVERSKWLLTAMMALTMIGLLGLIAYIFLKPPPAEFLRVEMLTHNVRPSGGAVAAADAGSVKMTAWVESPLDPSCLVSTQYFIEYADGSMWKLPGARYTTTGETKEAMYSASVPVTGPAGRAWFFVRDTYNCGIHAQRIQTPKVPFMVLPPV